MVKSSLFSAVTKVLECEHPDRLFDSVKINEIISLLEKVDTVYESLPKMAFPEVLIDEKPCPLGKEHCHLNDPHCNLSPGLCIVQFEGRECEMCGDCYREVEEESNTLIELKGQARSLGGSV